MPIDPGYGERLARRVSELFGDAELTLIRMISETLAEGIDAPDWVWSRLQALGVLRRNLAEQLDTLTVEAAKRIEDVVDKALTIGQQTATADLVAAGVAVAVSPTVARAVTAIAGDTTATVQALPTKVLRQADDAYRRIVGDASAQVLMAGQTRRQAAQIALDRLVDRGIAGFTDKAGRRWELESYVEMAVRTGTGQAAVLGHTQTLAASGQDLVIVSDAPRECPKCRPWEGKILSISGSRRGTVEVESATTREPLTIRVAGSVAEAKADGLQHPNCRHSLSLYLPGATKRRPAVSDPEGYKAQQRQRAIERAIRKWKRREAAALDDEAHRTAAARRAEWQQAMRDHLDAYPDLKRQSHREQVERAR